MPKTNLKKLQIPRVIHQSYSSKTIPIEFANNIQKIKNLNPTWEYRFYDDEDIIKFISENYGAGILEVYNKINPKYGAARADFFRYLLIYKVGGVWLDIKSTITKPLDENLEENDYFLLSQWENRLAERHAGRGIYREIAFVPGGEFQQWHIVSAPGNPLLQNVINNVIYNINNYNIEKHGTGSFGVFKTTGSFVYTLSMFPKILKEHPHKFVNISKKLGIEYSIFKEYEHKKFYKETHYSDISEAIVLR